MSDKQIRVAKLAWNLLRSAIGCQVRYGAPAADR